MALWGVFVMLLAGAALGAENACQSAGDPNAIALFETTEELTPFGASSQPPAGGKEK